MTREEQIAKENTDFILDRLVLNVSSFEEYQALSDEYLSAAGLPAYGTSPHTQGLAETMSPEDALRQRYEAGLKAYREKEEMIISSAKKLVGQQIGPTVSDETFKKFKTNDIGKKIAQAPGLTILDGGPGAGKSFSLAQSMDAMEVPVVCLGATSSAAAGLYEDMAKASKKSADKHKEPVGVFGGLTVEEFMNPQTEEQKKKKAEIEALFEKTPKPCFMVDEAGLLGHDEMAQILEYTASKGLKVILAGDSQQIPPDRGQPFKVLVESLKDTPAYVNAPYVFRQGDFVEKAITSGVYHGNCSDEMKISTEMATEFMVAAFDAGKKWGSFSEKDNVTPFKDYMESQYSISDEDPVPEGKMSKKDAVKDYVEKLGTKAEEFFHGDVSAMRAALEKGPVDGNYDQYVCAALMCQTMGMKAYEMRGKIQTKDDVNEAVAKEFAANYQQSLVDGLAKRTEEAVKDGKDPSKLTDEYADGMLAITATPEEAKALNATIRAAVIEANGGKVPDKEPVIVDGERKLLSAEDMKKEIAAGKSVDYAYALDVTTTQGMSQTGKVILVVDPKTQQNMQGGEILVGASRHKGGFEIFAATGTDMKAFYENSTHQYAAARVAGDVFRSDLFEAAGGEKAKVSGKTETAKTTQAESRTGNAAAFKEKGTAALLQQMLRAQELKQKGEARDATATQNATQNVTSKKTEKTSQTNDAAWAVEQKKNQRGLG